MLVYRPIACCRARIQHKFQLEMERKRQSSDRLDCTVSTCARANRAIHLKTSARHRSMQLYSTSHWHGTCSRCPKTPLNPREECKARPAGRIGRPNCRTKCRRLHLCSKSQSNHPTHVQERLVQIQFD